MRRSVGVAPQSPALALIDQRLEPVIGDGDPLHVRRRVLAAGAKRPYVVNMPARARAAVLAGGGAGVIRSERAHLGAISRNRLRGDQQDGEG
jgi:hypothetical protein